VPTHGSKMLAMQGVLPVLAQEEIDASAVLAHPSKLALPGDEPMPNHRAWPNPYGGINATAWPCNGKELGR
jgi:hypothetical protein